MTGIGLFLDRDGTINKDVGYPSDFGQIRLYPFSVEAIRDIHRLGFLAVVVTNQSGIGRGFFTEDELAALHARFAAAFEKRRARLDGFFHCPHFSSSAPAAAESDCSCRKPNPALGLRAAAALGLDLQGSYMVGDKTADVLFGLNVGAVPVLVLTGYGKPSSRELEATGIRPAHVAERRRPGGGVASAEGCRLRRA